MEKVKVTVKDLINKLSKLDENKEVKILIGEYDIYKIDHVYKSIDGDVIIYSETQIADKYNDEEE